MVCTIKEHFFLFTRIWVSFPTSPGEPLGHAIERLAATQGEAAILKTYESYIRNKRIKTVYGERGLVLIAPAEWG